MNNNSKYLFDIETDFDLNEFKKAYNNFPSFFWFDVFIQSIFGLIISLIIGLISKKTLLFLVFFIVYEFLLIIYNNVKKNYYIENRYNNLINNKLLDKKSKFFFYDSYFVKNGEYISLTVYYKDIKKCIETDSNFYFVVIGNRLISVSKNDCSLKLINFIKEKVNIEYKKEKNRDEINKKEKIYYVILKLSYAVNIFSIFGALLSCLFLIDFNNLFKISSLKNLWICFFWIFIPITTYLFGMLFKNISYESKKVRISSIIVGIILLCFGCLSMFTIGKDEYELINGYKDVIDVDLPAKGSIEFKSPNYETGVVVCDDIIKFKYFNVNYKNVNTSKLEKSIKNNKNWVSCDRLNESLKKMLNRHVKCDNKNTYVFIYNKTNDEYNIFPELPGEYEFYIMEYEFDYSYLKIESFIYKRS